MDDEAPPEKKKDEGAPAWVMTFADLMSLLMCFFVLLLSFSEMDVAKYKQIAGSMREAFGVQRKHKVKEPPKGINIIAQEFSAGRPDPTPFNIVEQMTTDTMKMYLDTGDKKRKRNEGEKGRKGGGPKIESGHDGNEKGALKEQGQMATTQEELVVVPKADAMEMLKAKQAAEARKKKLQNVAREIRSALAREIDKGTVDVETTDQRILIRIRDKALFGPASSYLRESFRPVLIRVGKILKGVEGRIVVAGHTDDLPIFTERYRSNWELSSSRAVSVVHELIDEAGIEAARVAIEGYGDTQPVAPNDSPENRARNRRVEIILEQGEDLVAPGHIAASEGSSRLSPGAVGDGQSRDSEGNKDE